MSNLITSYSSDSGDPFAVRGVGYGSVGSGSKEVITNGYMNGTSEAPRHRRTNSEISTSTFASNVSIDKSVEPAKMDMTKSSMFKGMTDKGVVKLQLPKDNFRLLSDRDLGKCTVCCMGTLLESRKAGLFQASCPSCQTSVKAEHSLLVPELL